MIDLNKIKAYFLYRGAKFPENPKDALDFALTEFGEIVHAYYDMKNHYVTNSSELAKEFGDTYCMLQIACYLYCNCSVEQYEEETDTIFPGFWFEDGKHNVDIAFIELTRIYDGILRQDKSWVRNNNRIVDPPEKLFHNVYCLLDRASRMMTGQNLERNLKYKWAEKGFKV